jgi:site-specific recombinase XerD
MSPRGKFSVVGFLPFSGPIRSLGLLKPSKMGPDIPQDTKEGIPMTLKEAITLFGYHQRSNLKPRTVKSYQPLLQRFEAEFGERSFDSIGSDEIFQFLKMVTGDHSKSTRRLRYAQLKAFFNFLIDKCNLNMKNPCDVPLLCKAFKTPKQVSRRILDREIVEELIYNTQTLRDRLMVELQVRCGLRIGESLKIKVSDVSDRKLVLKEPKSGKGVRGGFYAGADCQTAS